MFIAEQNLVAVAVGFATRGHVPFASTFAAFFTRAADQIRVAGISQANIKLVGSHVGISIGEDGPSQMALEDLALMRAIVGSTVLYPAEAVATEKLLDRWPSTRGFASCAPHARRPPLFMATTSRSPSAAQKRRRKGSRWLRLIFTPLVANCSPASTRPPRICRCLVPPTRTPNGATGRTRRCVAARFVAALEAAGGGEDRRRSTKLENIAGMGSPYQFARHEAFQRLQSLKEPSPDDGTERVPISKLVTPILPEYAPKDFFDCEDVERLLGNVESILWCPDELGDYCCRLAELTKYRELPDFSRELRRVLVQMKTEHLWGSYLLAVSSRVHRTAQPDWYFLLEDTIMRSRGTVQAIKDATDDLLAEFHVDPEAALMTTRGSLGYL